MSTEVGIVTIGYSEEGKVTQAVFEPTIKVGLATALEQQLESVQGSSQEEKVKSQADIVMSAYFSQMNEIELADREQYEIASDVVRCEKYESGNIKLCVIRYVFRKRTDD